MFQRGTKILLFIAMSIWSESCRKKPLTISDLDLSNIIGIRNEIATNKIKRVYYISDNSKKVEKQRTFAHAEYDCLGRETISYLYPPYEDTKTFQYDSLGLLRQIDQQNNGAKKYIAHYFFDSKTNILSQIWTGDTQDTCLYYFDKKGILTKSVICEDIGNGAFRYINKYEYYSGTRLKKITSFQIENRRDTAISHTNTKWLQFYYSNGHIDSTIESFNYISGNHFNKREVYDKFDLPTACVNDDGYMIRYRYERR